MTTAGFWRDFSDLSCSFLPESTANFSFFIDFKCYCFASLKLSPLHIPVARILLFISVYVRNTVLLLFKSTNLDASHSLALVESRMQVCLSCALLWWEKGMSKRWMKRKWAGDQWSDNEKDEENEKGVGRRTARRLVGKGGGWRQGFSL